MKLLASLVITLSFFFFQKSGCSEESTEEMAAENDHTEQSASFATDSMSQCIQEKIEFFKENRSTLNVARIYSYKNDSGETFYMFDEGMMVDGPAYVLSNECDTLCLTGGMRMVDKELRECPPEAKDSRVVIWSKGNE